MWVLRQAVRQSVLYLNREEKQNKTTAELELRQAAKSSIMNQSYITLLQLKASGLWTWFGGCQPSRHKVLSGPELQSG